ncbi:MAG: hypothetical protein ACRDSZ_07075 [Pseudonocardiaceae bacterium]
MVYERVVDEGNLITSGGVMAGIDLALWFVERFTNQEFADGLARRVEYQRVRPAEATSPPHDPYGAWPGLPSVADQPIGEPPADGSDVACRGRRDHRKGIPLRAREHQPR